MAHIINPVIVGEESDLFVAQPITFETIEIARESAHGQVEVELYATQYPEDRPLVPEGFRTTPDLDRSVLDLGMFQKRRKLPLIRDILDRLYEATEAEYLIYTNVDIALMPHFYLAVDRLLALGYDALVVNRRSISRAYVNSQDIPLMVAQVGEPHPGCDCFVFKRNVYPNYQLGTAFIGSGRIGLILAVNLYYHATRFKQVRDLHLTFHIGDDKSWQSADLRDERLHNDNELKKILAHYNFAQNPPDDPILAERLLRVYEPQPRYRRIARRLRARLGAGKRRPGVRRR
jgi:hypothetical protein